MEGSVSWVAFIFTISIALSSASGRQFYCCEFSFIALDLSSRRCEIDVAPWLPCDNLSSVPYLEVDETYFIKKDNETYFNSNKNKSFWPDLSLFCVAPTMTNETVDRNLSVIFCKHEMSDRQRSNRFHQKILDGLRYKNVEVNLWTIGSLVSAVSLTIVTVLYITRPATQDIEEKCILHLAFNQCLFYFGCAYASVVLSTGFVEPHLGDFCVVFWHLVVFVELSSFMWCAIMTYHLQKTFRLNSKMNESKRFRRYAMVGYGIPALFVVLCNIHVQANTYIHGDALERSCDNHFGLMRSLYGLLPLLIIMLTNIYFFDSIRRHIRKFPSSPSEYSITSMERFSFRLSVNKKLLILLVFPWLMIAILWLLALVFESLWASRESAIYSDYLVGAGLFLLCCEGIILSYVLIISHRNLYDEELMSFLM